MSERILIVGGGIGGLTLAGLLERRLDHLEVTLVERAESWAPVGAGISLTGNAVRQLDSLDLVPALRERGVNLESGLIADARGRVLASTEATQQVSGRDPFSNEVIAIHRAELHRVLRSAVRSTEVLLGVEPSGFEDSEVGTAVTLSTGETRPFDLVIGADGVSSRVRAEVLGAIEPPFRYAGYTCWRSVLSMPGSESAPSRTSWELWGRGKRFGVVPVGGDLVYFYACVNAPESDPRWVDLDRGDFVGLFSDLGGPVPEVLAAIGDDTKLHHDDLGDVSLPVWSRGCYLLIGDAAHATTPNLGQGAALAIEDASVLSRLFAEARQNGHSLRSCFVPFERRRRARVERLQLQARRIGRVAQWRFAPATWLRNTMVALTPNRVAAAQLHKVVDEEI